MQGPMTQASRRAAAPPPARARRVGRASSSPRSRSPRARPTTSPAAASRSRARESQRPSTTGDRLHGRRPRDRWPRSLVEPGDGPRAAPAPTIAARAQGRRRRPTSASVAPATAAERAALRSAREGQARAHAGSSSTVPVGPRADAATDLGRELDLGTERRRGECDLPRRPGCALGRHAGPLQAGSPGRRVDRLPDRPAHPARGVRLVRGRRAAARARLRERCSSPARLIFFLSQAIEMSVFVTNMASMIGIGVAVDYSLFVLARYREEMHAGRTTATRRCRTAMRTSGLAVIFSGLTVMRVARRAVPRRQRDAALDGARRDPRRRGRRCSPRRRCCPCSSGCSATAPTRAAGSFTVSGLVLRSRAPRRRGSTHPDAPPRRVLGALDRARHRAAPWSRWSPTAGAAARARRPRSEPQDGRRRAAPVPERQRDARRRRARRAADRRRARRAAEVARPLRDGTRRRPGELAAVTALRAPLRADRGSPRGRPRRASRDGRSAARRGHAARTIGESRRHPRRVERLRDDLPRRRPARERRASRSAAPPPRMEDFKDLVSGSMWKIVLFVLGAQLPRAARSCCARSCCR